MLAKGRTKASGELRLKVIRNTRGPGLKWHLQNRLRWGYIWGYITVAFAKWFSKVTGIPTIVSSLRLVVIKKNGERIDYGIVGRRVVTTAGVNAIVDAFQNTVELETLKFHGIGTGSTAEAIGDTALVTELTTEYTPDNTRATGTTIEGDSTNEYRTVATNTLSGAGAALREHGIFSQAATGGGTLLDRTVYALITLADGDSLQSTYDLLFPAGS